MHVQLIGLRWTLSLHRQDWHSGLPDKRRKTVVVVLHGIPAAGVSQTLRRGTMNGITELSQRAPPIFGWAAITFGIGPHSSSRYKVLNYAELSAVYYDWLRFIHGCEVLCYIQSRSFASRLPHFAIHRVKWRHISMVAIRSPFCRSRPSYCA